MIQFSLSDSPVPPVSASPGARRGSAVRRLPWVVAVFLGVLAFASAAQARGWDPERPPSKEDQRHSLTVLLSAHHYRPDRALLDQVGPDVNTVLVYLATDRRERPEVRRRAVTSLGLYPSDRTQRFLTGLLFERSLLGTPEGTLIRREALVALARAFKGAVVDDLASLRHDENPQVREACARALGMTDSRSALPILEAWLPHEQVLNTRLAVDEAYQHLIREGR